MKALLAISSFKNSWHPSRMNNDSHYWLTDKPTPLFAVEHSAEYLNHYI